MQFFSLSGIFTGKAAKIKVAVESRLKFYDFVDPDVVLGDQPSLAKKMAKTLWYDKHMQKPFGVT